MWGIPEKEAAVSRLIINALAAAIAIGGAVVSSNVARSNSAEPVQRRAYVTRAEFDQAFADVAAGSRSGNTPATREKLRDLGWKRLIPPIASKPIASKPIT